MHYITVRPSPGIRNVILLARMACAMPLRAPRFLSRRWWNSLWPIPPTVTLADGKDDRGIRWQHVWREGPPSWVHRRPWAVYKYWATSPSLVVDVSVTMFQQSILKKLEVPWIQFLDRLVDIPVGLRWCCTVRIVQRIVEFRRSSSLVWC